MCPVLICIFRAAETSQDVESLRPPRFIHEDGVIRPYKEREGIGSQMLQVTCSFPTRCKNGPSHTQGVSELSDKTRLQRKKLFNVNILLF